MAKETIIVEITAEAEVTVTTEGYAGKACLEATKDLEAVLGIVKTNTPTSEMNKREVRNAAERHNRA